jgi:DNA-binding response OmpR family regulator
LVVDDEADARGLLDYALSGEGFDVTTAATGIEGVKKAREVLPDVILLDIMLPDIDGFMVADMLRRQPATADIPVVILSARGGTAVQVRGAECGVYSCLIKSAGLEAIIAGLREALEHRRAPANGSSGE